MNPILAMFDESEKHHKPCPKCGAIICSRPYGIKAGDVCISCEKAEAVRRDRENRMKSNVYCMRNERIEGIPEFYHFADFKDFTKTDIKTGRPHAEELESWYLTPNRPLFIWGDCGGGKTRAAYAIRRRAYVDHVIMAGGLCGEILREAEALQHAFGGALRDYVRQLTNHHGIVVLDDFGACKIGDFQAGVISDIISIRAEHGRPLVICSNLKLSEVAGLLGDRVASRLAGGIVLFWDYPDHRINGKGGK